MKYEIKILNIKYANMIKIDKEAVDYQRHG